nr:hypothetical protein Iba_chr06eCG11130 [Ipomoea batatas]
MQNRHGFCCARTWIELVSHLIPRDVFPLRVCVRNAAYSGEVEDLPEYFEHLNTKDQIFIRGKCGIPIHGGVGMNADFCPGDREHEKPTIAGNEFWMVLVNSGRGWTRPDSNPVASFYVECCKLICFRVNAIRSDLEDPKHSRAIAIFDDTKQKQPRALKHTFLSHLPEPGRRSQVFPFFAHEPSVHQADKRKPHQAHFQNVIGRFDTLNDSKSRSRDSSPVSLSDIALKSSNDQRKQTKH